MLTGIEQREKSCDVEVVKYASSFGFRQAAFEHFQKGKGSLYQQLGVDVQVKNVVAKNAAGQMRKAIESIIERVRPGHVPVAVVNMPTKTKRGKERTRLMAALPLETLAELLAIKHQWEVETVER